MKQLDVYWSFRSPYSYLATPGLVAIRENYDVEVNLRVVLPVAVRAPELLFTPQNMPKVRYIQLDWARRARFLGMSDQWPNPDPIVQNLETLEVAKKQPHIYRLSYMGVEAQRQGRGIDLAYEFSHVIFGGIKDWHEGDTLAEAAKRAGLNYQDLEKAIEDGTHQAEIDKNQQTHTELGQWGVPSCVIDGEAFFGQDRLETLCWHMDNLGLRKN